MKEISIKKALSFDPNGFLDCDHVDLMEIRKQIKTNGRVMLRKQCTFCGFTETSQLKHSSVDNINRVKEIDIDARDYRISLYFEKSRLDWEQQQKERHEAYNDYINSFEWKAKRMNIVVRDKGLCVLCKSKGEHVHHLTYKNFGNEDNRDLILLCKECHEYIHEKTIG